MSDTKAEPLTVEIVEEAEADHISDKMAQMRSYRTKGKPKGKGYAKMNPTDTCDRMGYDPLVTLILIAQNDFQALGHTKPVPIPTMKSAADSILHITVPGLKPVDFVNTEAVQEMPMTYIPDRGSAEEVILRVQKELDAELELEEEEYEYEYITDESEES